QRRRNDERFEQTAEATADRARGDQASLGECRRDVRRKQDAESSRRSVATNRERAIAADQFAEVQRARDLHADRRRTGGCRPGGRRDDQVTTETTRRVVRAAAPGCRLAI